MTQSLRERENDTTIHKNEQVHDFFPRFSEGTRGWVSPKWRLFEDDDNAVPFLKGANFQVMTPMAQIIQKTSRGCFSEKMAALCDFDKVFVAG